MRLEYSKLLPVDENSARLSKIRDRIGQKNKRNKTF